MCENWLFHISRNLAYDTFIAQFVNWFLVFVQLLWNIDGESEGLFNLPI